MGKDEDNYEMKCVSACYKKVDEPVKCQNADIEVGNSSTLGEQSIECSKNFSALNHESSTFHIENIKCSKNCTIKTDHSSTTIIGSLDCDENCEINTGYSSKLRIDNSFICRGKCTIIADYTSTIIIEGANISGHADIKSLTHFLGGCTVLINGTVDDRNCEKGWSSTLKINGKTCS